MGEKTLDPGIDAKAYVDQSIGNIQKKRVDRMKEEQKPGNIMPPSEKATLPEDKWEEDGEILSKVPTNVDSEAFASQSIDNLAKNK